MIEVKEANGAVQMTFPSNGMSPEQVDDFVTWLRVEGLARRSRLTPENVFALSEEIKSGWWGKNKQRFGACYSLEWLG